MLRHTLPYACGVIFVLGWGVCSGQTTQPAGVSAAPTTAPADEGAGMPALRRASEARKYSFVLFYKDDDDQTKAARKAVEAAVARVPDRAVSVAVDIRIAAEKRIVEKYSMAAAPMPLMLAIAPSGAITGGFPIKFEEKDLLGVFVSPCTERSLAALQSGKLALICAQNSRTQSNEAASKGAQEFKDDKRFAEFTELIRVDPGDATEAKFMGQLRIDPNTSEAVTILLAPPGSVVSVVRGKVDKDALIAALATATSGGCGPGGCGPGGCGPALAK